MKKLFMLATLAGTVSCLCLSSCGAYFGDGKYEHAPDGFFSDGNYKYDEILEQDFC